MKKQIATKHSHARTMAEPIALTEEALRRITGGYLDPGPWRPHPTPGTTDPKPPVAPGAASTP
jgi:hypothetical protein